MSEIFKLFRRLAVIFIFVLTAGCAVPLMGPAILGGTAVMSKSDEEKLTNYVAKNFGVDSSQVLLTDIERESQMMGVAGNKYYFNAYVVDDPSSSTANEFRCQLLWHAFTKSPPICNKLGEAPVSLDPETGGLQIGTAGPTSTTVAVAPVALEPLSVLEAQSMLSTAGYDPGPIDGLMGSKTRSALISFQSDRGLTPSGEIDADTSEALRTEFAPQQ